MKRVLFISRSKLSHNLLRAVLPLTAEKTDLVCLDSADEIPKVPKRGKPFRLVVVDSNCFGKDENPKEFTDRLNEHPLAKKAGRVLIYSHLTDVKKDLLRKKGFGSFHAKPFSAEELANIVCRS